MPDRGDSYIRGRRGESTRYGLPALVSAIEAAALEVDERYPGSFPLRVGDLSSPSGGRHPRHGSHRTGRDVDLIFYATDTDGRPVPGRGWIAYDRHGVGVEPEDFGGRVRLFDDARNWALVRAFMTNPNIRVQWFFVSSGLKARLLRYAAAHETDAELVSRATWLLHQPRGASPHADHFHVRIMCGAEQAAAGCEDRAPHWRFFSDRIRKEDFPGKPITDDLLLRALFQMEPDEVP